MKLKKFYVFSLGAIFIAVMTFNLASCKKEDPTLPDFYYRYFPTELGTWVIYDVDSMHHDLNLSDTFHFQVKEVIAEDFVDDEGNPSQRIQRFYRDTDTDPWMLKDVWVSTRTNTMAQRVEENERFVKMIFPVGSNDDWDGNAFNTQEEWECEYEDVHDTKTIGNLSFDSTASVRQNFYQTIVDDIDAYEIYAPNVGMIYRRYKNLYFGDPQIPIKGFEFYYTVTSYGQ